MATPILPFATWDAGTNQNSIPANDNSMRNEILNGLVLSDAVTSQPVSPSDGDIYILASTHTGTQWATFSPDDLVIYKNGTWYAFSPVDGVVVNFEGGQFQYTGSAGWEVLTGGAGGTAWVDITGVPANLTQIGALTDPNADRILFWDDSAGAYTHLTVGTGLTITGTTLDAAGGGGSVAGSDKQIQYNNAGAFGAEAGFEYDQSTNTFTVPKVNEAKGSNIASASTTDIGAATGNFVHVTGTTTITALGTVSAGARRIVVFDGALTLTYNATSLILPTSANITTAAGDAMIAVSEGSGNWRVTNYQKADGTALASGGGGGLTGLTSALSTSSPNNTVNVSSLSASGGSTDQDLALVPKGGGALQADITDNTATGGNRRGTGAVDWQMSRGAATQIAGGTASVIGGGNNNVTSGNYCTIAGGQQNSASGTHATVAGGTANNAAGNYNAIAGGNSNTASGQYGFIGSGISNTTSGNFYATIAGGSSNTASAQNSTVGGGDSNTASGQYSSILGGYQASTFGTFGAEAYASGQFATLGDAQRRRFIFRRSTTNATPADLTANNSAAAASTIVVLSNNSTFDFSIRVVSRSSSDQKSFLITGLITRGANAASTALVGTPTATTVAASGGASWTIAVTADTTNGGLTITATGVAATNIKWVADVQTVEVIG